LAGGFSFQATLIDPRFVGGFPQSLEVNRPGFTRHFLAYKFRPSRGCHEWEAIYRGISN